MIEGYFVKDLIQHGRVSGNLETTQANSSVVFGYVLLHSHPVFIELKNEKELINKN